MKTNMIESTLYYLAFAFGLAWLFGLIVFLTGGIANSPEAISGSKITVALLLISLGYMWAPALANLFTRLVTHQGWDDLLVKLNFKKGWKLWLAAWVGPALMTIAGGAIYFLIFPAQYDGNLTMLQKMLESTPGYGSVSPWLMVLGQLISAILVAPVINSFFTFGEEFGWRGYMLPLLLPLGEKKAFLVSGVIWGLWHAPVIVMGHNFGMDYPGFPWLGILVMTWFCILAGTFLGWASLRERASGRLLLAMQAINGIAGLAILFQLGKPIVYSVHLR